MKTRDLLDADLDPRRRWAPLVFAAVLPAVTIVLSLWSDTVLGDASAFLPAWLAVVVVCDLLTVALLVEQYRTGAGPRLLALSWAYIWSGVLVVPAVLSFPGVVSTNGIFGADPDIGWWLWSARHLGLPLLVGVALVPWPATLERWLGREDRRTRRVLGTHACVLAAAAGFVTLLPPIGRDLPRIYRATDPTSLRPGFGAAVVGINILILVVSLVGVQRRRDPGGLETWAIVALVAGIGDVALMSLTDGRWTLGWYAARMLGLAGAVIVLAAMLHEVSSAHTRARRLATQLQSQNDALRSAQGLRDHLIAVVSHDMRTPLAGLQGYLEVLLDDEGLSPELTRRMHDRSWMLTRRLALLTEDLLSVATIDHGDLQIIPEPLDLSRQLLDCATGFPELDLLVDCPEGLIAIADPLRLQQVLANLVRNAQKHGVEPVTLTAAPSAANGPTHTDTDAGTDTDTDTVTISVSDAGPGVPADFVPRLFERYTRADDRATAGSGLGLSVVRDLVEAHGGTATYDPAVNAFRVTLPAPAAVVAATAAWVPSRTRATSPTSDTATSLG